MGKVGRGTGRKPGFNASDRGFVTAPPVAVSPDNPDDLLLDTRSDFTPELSGPWSPSDDAITKMYGKYEDLTASSTEVALVEETPKRELKKSEDFQGETLQAAKLLGDSFGVPQDRAYRYLSLADYGVPHVEGEEYDFIPNDKAAAFVSQCVSYREDSTSGQKLVDDVREGRITLTRRELLVMAGIRDAIMEEQSLDALDYAGGQDWIPLTEQRHCEVCGQFIGLRTSHINCSAGREFGEKLVKARNEAGWSKVDDLPADLFTTGEPLRLSSHADSRRETLTSRIAIPYNRRYHTKQKIRDSINLTEDEMQDLYCAGGYNASYYGTSNDTISTRDILLSYFKKPLIGDPKISLPHGLRRTFVEAPVLDPSTSSGDTVAIVAALIDPPLAKHEIEHIIDVGGPVAARALLQVKRTQADTLEILSNYPSHAGAALSYDGTIPLDTVKSMIDSPDPRVQREAAMSSHLTDEDINRLISNPDPAVRRTLINIREGFAMDPDHPRRNPDNTLISSEKIASEYYYHRSYGAHQSVLKQHPALLNTFLGSEEPDDEVAVYAFEEAPLTRQTLQALTQVRSRTRLQMLQSSLSGREIREGGDAAQIKGQALQLIARRLQS